MKMTYTLILFTSLLITSGCANYRPQVGPIWAQKLLAEGPEGASPLFQKGWQDGCETGISVTSNAYQRHFYHFTQDSELARNREYYTAWKTGYTYCQRYVFQYLRRVIL